MAGTRQRQVKVNNITASSKRRRVVTESSEVAKHASMLTGHAKTQLLAATSVPLPKRRYGPAKQRQKSMLQKTAAHSCNYWSKNAPTFRIPGVKIKQLSERSKPSKGDKAYAAKIMHDMADWESNAFSAKFTDEDGNLLAAYFSNRIITMNNPILPEVMYVGGPQTPRRLHCSVYDLKQAQRDDKVKLAFDGIPPDIVEDALYASQVLHHFLRPHKNKRDGRHDFSDFLMRYKRKGGGGVEEVDEDQDQDDDDSDWEDAPATFSHAGLEMYWSLSSRPFLADAGSSWKGGKSSSASADDRTDYS
ncbi:hypothetical protein BDR04DRAFT_1164944 [Suillus decipiens]|nr:hypothetical protein BDR04DRAFT_1164944 [Suillus decipiens]